MTNRNFFNIELTEGSDYSESFVYQDPCTSLPIDLTGYTAELKARISMNGNYDGYDIPDFVLDIGTATGEIVLGGTAGTVTVSIAADTTVGLNWNRAVYTLMLTSSQGKKVKFMEGFMTILGSAI